MKKLTMLLFAALLAIQVFGQKESETIQKANDLIANKKYESAFKLLQDFDPKNTEPDIVLLKEDIVLNYYITSIMHQMFALKDLEKDEHIMDIRGKQGSYGMYQFPANDILDSLIKIYPHNYKLYKGLATFYYDAQQKYQGQWLKSDSIVSGLIIKNDQLVIDHGLADFNTYYMVGLELLTQKKYKEAIPYFIKSLELNKDFADTHYNLAYAYLFSDELDSAMKYAKSSFDLYVEQGYKGDAARMIAEIYSESKDSINSIKYYDIANTLDPNNYYNLKPLLNLYVKSGNPKLTETLNEFYDLAPDKPIIYNDLEDIFYDNNKVPDLITFYKSKISVYQKDTVVEGNLNLFLGQIYLDTDKKTAKEYFLKAKEIFSTVFDKDHEVFDAIDEGIKEAEQDTVK